MTADDTTAARDDAARTDPGRSRRELVRIGARASAAWIAEVVTRGRRLMALAAGAAAGVAMAMLIHPVLRRADGDDTALSSSIALGLLVGAAVAIVPVTVWLTRAIRRHPSVTGSHPRWRDAALLDGAVDARGRVTLPPGAAERVATESRRAIASSTVGLPGAALLVSFALIGIPAYALVGEVGVMAWSIPVYLLSSSATLWAQCITAGRMALLRDAADAELALPASERSVASPVEPPLGSRLP